MDKKSEWIKRIKDKGGFNKAAVALANKQVRVMWALLKTGECYRKAAAQALATQEVA